MPIPSSPRRTNLGLDLVNRHLDRDCIHTYIAFACLSLFSPHTSHLAFALHTTYTYTCPYLPQTTLLPAAWGGLPQDNHSACLLYSCLCHSCLLLGCVYINEKGRNRPGGLSPALSPSAAHLPPCLSHCPFPSLSLLIILPSCLRLTVGVPFPSVPFWLPACWPLSFSVPPTPAAHPRTHTHTPAPALPFIPGEMDRTGRLSCAAVCQLGLSGWVSFSR